MLDKIKKNKQLFSNFSYMFAIEMANYILPFLAVPHIVKTVGITNFGVVTFAYVFIAYFDLILNYGFKMIIIKDISLFRSSNKKISFLFWKMYISQLFLLFFAFMLFSIILYFTQISQYKEVFLFSFLMVIGNFLSPIWFFQGIEQMKFIAIFNFIARLSYIILVFIFIKKKDDYIYIPLLNSISFITIGIISLIFIFEKYHIQIIFPKKSQIKKFFKDGWHLFLSSLTVNLYSNVNVLLLGFMVDYNAVGIYSLADKIFGAIIRITGVVNTVLFPHLSKIASNKELLIKKFQLLFQYHVLGLIVLSLIVFMLADFITTILFGNGNETSILILKIMAFVLFLRPFGQLFTNYLVITKQNKIISKITFQTMLFNMFFVFPLIYFFKEIGLAITILIVQIFQLILNIKQSKEMVI